MVKKVMLSETMKLYTQTDEPGISANTYVLEGKPTILIDAGFEVDEKVDIVVLTHCHLDHSQHVKHYQKLGAKIAVSAKDGKELELASEIVSPQHFRKKFGITPNPIKPDIFLKEGDIISNGNFKLEVIDCPGHTPGSIALYDKEKGILFSGDTWYGKATIGSWKHAGGSFPELQKSVEKLKSLNPKILCSGHGAAKWRKKK